MNYRSLHFFNQKARILRANYMVDVTTIRDRILTDYSTVKDKVSCMVQDGGNDVINHPLAGMISVDRADVYFPGNCGVLPNDLLLIRGVYYDVGQMDDHSFNGWEIVAHCVKRNIQRS
jgi:hypothetical protein